MFADVLFPPDPTYYADWYMIGWPASLIVPLALTASLVTFFLFLARRKRPRRTVAVFILCAVVFVAADFAVYWVGITYFEDVWLTRRRSNRNVERQQIADPRVKHHD
jgi:small-conductance mechanosensitive channel